MSSDKNNHRKDTPSVHQKRYTGNIIATGNIAALIFVLLLIGGLALV